MPLFVIQYIKIIDKGALFTGKGIHMKGIKKIFMVAALSFSMLATSVSVQNIVGTQETVQAATIKLNKNKIILKTGARTKLKVMGTKKKVKWGTDNKFVATVDKKTMITNVSVTLQDPKVAAIVADSAVRKLQKSIIGYRTSKAKDDCAYLENLFKERQIEYYDTQKKYANYVDTHDNLILQSVRTEQERLQNDMSLAYQVYSQVANQLQVARAKVQEEKPVFAIVEPAVVPLQPSGIGKKVYILLFVFLAVAVTIVWMFIGKELLNRFREMK